MTVTVQSFQTDFPEFSNIPPAQVSFWLNVAFNMVDQCLFGNLADQVTELLMAHFIAVFNQVTTNLANNQPGALIGASSAVLASKGAGPLSAGYDVAAATIADAGNFNLTAYGTTFKWFQKIFGAGGIQITGGFNFEAYLAFGGPAGGLSGGAGGDPGGF
jgi:Protein of unknown function (DUF4054)